MDAYVLAAGQQIRYGQHESKMMAPINNRPAFAYTMDTLLSAFPQERITVITSLTFPDFNNFVTETYPQSNLVVDKNSGKGTAHSLSKTFPWNSEKAFVTEADIYYKPQLIESHLELMGENPEIKTIVTVTPQTLIAPTHRGIEVFPKLEIPEASKQKNNPSHKNVGAHTISSDIENYWNGNTENVIDVLRFMQAAEEPMLAHIYLSAYLHMANTEDIEIWNDYFQK